MPTAVAPAQAAANELARLEPTQPVESEEPGELRDPVERAQVAVTLVEWVDASQHEGEPSDCGVPRAFDPIFGRFPDRDPDEITAPVRGCRRAAELPGARKQRSTEPSEKASVRAVRAGLEWLSGHQACDGRWSSDDSWRVNALGQVCVCEAPAPSSGDIGSTGLALLAFLGYGNTTRVGPYKESVSRGVNWLRELQDKDTGLIGSQVGHRFAYDHAIATLAITEAYDFSKNPLIKSTAQNAIHYILRERDPVSDWWRGAPSSRGDDKESEWARLALSRAEKSGLTVDAAEPQRRGAERGGGIRCMSEQTGLPGAALDALAARARGEPIDAVHARELEQRLLSVQRQDGDAAGSWNPDIVLGHSRGRVDSTALALLTLEACVFASHESRAGARRPR